MASIRLKSVKNRFVRIDDFSVANGCICAVVGPSGAGKTSMLRIVAGLSKHEGSVIINEEEIQHISTYKRKAGFVSQDLHLFPHLTLEGNIDLAMHSLDIKRSERVKRIKELAELLRIYHLMDRKPDTFSGGEKQRAALARVLASDPEILLLDEPFSKLDFRTARYLRQEFRNLQKKLSLTTIIVTHDIQEAREMADSIWVMQDGVLASSISSYTTEGTRRDDSFLEVPNIIFCSAIECLDNGLASAQWAGGTLLLPYENRKFSKFTVSRRKIQIGSKPPEGPPINRFKGEIEGVKETDDGIILSIKIGNTMLMVELSCDYWSRMGLSQGETVHGYMRLRDLRCCN